MDDDKKSWWPQWMIPRADVCPKCDRLEPDHDLPGCPGPLMSLAVRIRRARKWPIWWMLRCDLAQMPKEWRN